MRNKMLVKRMALNLLNDKFKQLLQYIKEEGIKADADALNYAFSGFSGRQNFDALIRSIVRDLVDCYDLHIYRCTNCGEYKFPKSLMALADETFAGIAKRLKYIADNKAKYEDIVSYYCTSDDPESAFDMIILLALYCNKISRNYVAAYAAYAAEY